MQTTLALVALASVASAAIGDSPSSGPADGCSTSYDGAFQITIVSPTAAKVKRQSTTCGQAGLLTATLSDGILKDSDNRQGEIVANYQFQFDDILQPGAIYTEGFNICNNGSLAIGGNAEFYECATSGGPGIGNYSNLYSQSIGPQCNPILIDIIPCSSDSTSTTAVAGQSADGQVTATGTPGAPVSQVTDGQVQATATGTVAGCAVSQISDGQLQMVTSCPAPVSQISDGQIQATSTGAPVSQISDGQIQATTTAAPVSQISDGQVQATATGAPVSQISDGQVQATTVATMASSAPASNATASAPLQVTNNSNGKSIASTFAAILVGVAAVLLL